MKRAAMRDRMRERTDPWDMVIIGGGATGVGVAVDAAARGYDVLLLEQSDFGKGTSSRSTKLVHGGVRYLEQGNLGLVMESLGERALLLRNAPHVVHDLPFVVPLYRWWEGLFYGLGLKLYSLLAGRHEFGPARVRRACRHPDALAQSAAPGIARGRCLSRRPIRRCTPAHQPRDDSRRPRCNAAKLRQNNRARTRRGGNR